MLHSLLIFCFCVGSFAVKIPDYLVPCSRQDDVCLTDHAQKTLEGVLPGDKTFNIPPLTPLVLPLVQLLEPAINVTFTNLSVDGLQNGKIQSVKIDTVNQLGKVVFSVPKVYLTGDYDVDGRILILNLKGSDKANITAVEVLVTWTFYYNLTERKGEKYAKIYKEETVFKLKNALIQLDKIIRDNDLLTKHINEILTEEWSAVFDELVIGIQLAIGNVFKLVTESFFKRIPFDQLLKP